MINNTPLEILASKAIGGGLELRAAVFTTGIRVIGWNTAENRAAGFSKPFADEAEALEYLNGSRN